VGASVFPLHAEHSHPMGAHVKCVYTLNIHDSLSRSCISVIRQKTSDLRSESSVKRLLDAEHSHPTGAHVKCVYTLNTHDSLSRSCISVIRQKTSPPQTHPQSEECYGSEHRPSQRPRHALALNNRSLCYSYPSPA
jgi:hypothetical protein